MSEHTEALEPLAFDPASLQIDAEVETARIVAWLQETVLHRFHRQGAVVAISGGLDSSVVLALCARAFGPQRVVGLLLPERESSPENIDLSLQVAGQFGVEHQIEDVAPVLEGYGCYRRRDEAIQRLFPEYQPGWKVKIILPGGLLDQVTLNVFHLVVTKPDGTELRQRLPLREYAQIVAASNFKQRARATLAYYHAELRNYAMIGTPNKNEHDLGFFVKWGDGGYDAAPIRHLYKSQVYQLARFLHIPEEIQSRTPLTDTYPGGGSQEEFFFRIPLHLLDAIWVGYEKGYSAEQIAAGLNLSAQQVQRVIDDILRKQRTTAFLRTPPLGFES